MDRSSTGLSPGLLGTGRLHDDDLSASQYASADGAGTASSSPLWMWLCEAIVLAPWGSKGHAHKPQRLVSLILSWQHPSTY